MKQIARYGWIPDHPDDLNDRKLVLPPLAKLPPSADLRQGCPPVYDQGQLGSCTANAIAAAFQFERAKQKDLPALVPSRLFIYYNEREMEGTVGQDSGAMIRDGLTSVAKQGVCDEQEWGYDPAKFAEKPGPDCYFNAKLDMAVNYARLNNANLDDLRSCLAAGFPFVFGFTVYESFESQLVARSGVVPMPKRGERVLGGHAVIAVGYNDGNQRFMVRNSWGESWGLKGYFTMPYAYLTNTGLADDFWNIQLVTPHAP